MHERQPENDLPQQKREILLSMWKAGAIGDRRIPLRDLKAKLADEARQNYRSYLENLKERLFIEVFSGGDDDLVSITSVGLAFIRQIQEEELRSTTGERGIRR